MKIDESTLLKICECNPAMNEQPREPFVVDGLKYYFNKYFGVRVPSQEQNSPDIDTNESARNVQINFASLNKICEGVVISKAKAGAALKNYAECSECDPAIKGPTIIDCVECDGEGVVDLENDFNYYQCDCKSCGGNGTKRAGKGKYSRNECPKCEGHGFISEKKFAWQVGKSFINPLFVIFLVSLFGEITLCDQGGSDTKRPVSFSVAGADLEGIIGILDMSDASDHEIINA